MCAPQTLQIELGHPIPSPSNNATGRLCRPPAAYDGALRAGRLRPAGARAALCTPPRGAGLLHHPDGAGPLGCESDLKKTKKGSPTGAFPFIQLAKRTQWTVPHVGGSATADTQRSRLALSLTPTPARVFAENVVAARRSPSDFLARFDCALHARTPCCPTQACVQQL